jgi:polar amino acid transport system substrate-binding protein
MKTRSWIGLARAGCLLAGMASGLACLPAFAGPASANAGHEGKLVMGVEYVVPPHVPGARPRTPEGVEMALAEDLASRLGAELQAVPVNPPDGTLSFSLGVADLAMVALSDTPSSVNRSAAVVIPTGYVAGPMAIMRTDTDIKSWEQLEGRTVCLAEGGRSVGRMAARYGAVEKVFRAPADSLLALRVGECDAAVHDHPILEALIRLPEWKKFSARLPVGPQASLAFVVPEDNEKNVAAAKQAVQDWKADRHVPELVTKMARDIAFEVYLDQEGPDCH